MQSIQKSTVAIIDYGLGNLFSIQKACEQVGLAAIITADKEEIMNAACLILPGVGAFGDAMLALNRLDLTQPIQDFVQTNKPVLGICLGLQLLFTESNEFGDHRGLDIIQGEVRRLPNDQHSETPLKVPQVGWNRIYISENGRAGTDDTGCRDPWSNTLLDGIGNGAFMYFVHSYYVKPLDNTQMLTHTVYGDTHFFQFHPERSGPVGLQVYKNLFALINE
jgi:glutamine amidotransferase